MTGRLASRAADAEALLVRFNEASESALAAISRGDRDAFGRAIGVRDALQAEIERAAREIATARARFAPNDEAGGVATRVADRAMAQFCAPLEELARRAQALQERLEAATADVRDGLLAEIATFENAATVATRYATAATGDPHRFDVVL